MGSVIFILMIIPVHGTSGIYSLFDMPYDVLNPDAVKSWGYEFYYLIQQSQDLSRSHVTT